MADRVPARLTARDGRRFGLEVGLALLVLAAAARWRGHGTSALALAALGALLVLGGLAVPLALAPVFRLWMGLAAALSRVTTPILMAVLYYLVLTPAGLLLRAVGYRPLTRARSAATAWVDRPARSRGRAGLERQF